MEYMSTCQKITLAIKVQQTPQAKEEFQKRIRFDLRDQENMDLLFKRTLGISGRRMNILYKLCEISLPIQQIPMQVLIKKLELNPRKSADLLNYHSDMPHRYLDKSLKNIIISKQQFPQSLKIKSKDVVRYAQALDLSEYQYSQLLNTMDNRAKDGVFQNEIRNIIYFQALSSD